MRDQSFMPDPSSAAPADHPPIAAARIGCLLVNLGTPSATDYWSVRRYLKQFLSDRRVIEAPPFIWQPLLQTVILSRRPFASGAAYAKIWDKEKNASPLRVITEAQAALLSDALRADTIVVDWAMRYGSPSIAEKIDALAAQGCRQILLFALYPQYSASTTASVYDEGFRHLMRLRWQPAVRTIMSYHDHPAYIGALAQSVKDQIAAQGWQPDRLVASFHGLPESYFKKGDPYHCHCQKTARLLREALDWPDDRFLVTFQSRFGPQEWLQPYFDETVEALPDQGVKAITVITPGFAADCIETLEEIAMEGEEEFLAAGGERFSMVPCLNTRSDHIAMMRQIVLSETQGWR